MLQKIMQTFLKPDSASFTNTRLEKTAPNLPFSDSVMGSGQEKTRAKESHF